MVSSLNMEPHFHSTPINSNENIYDVIKTLYFNISAKYRLSGLKNCIDIGCLPIFFLSWAELKA